jgi:hypothetical protein
VTKSPIKLSDLFRYYKQLPHQMAAITELEAVLLKVAPDAFNREQSWFKAWSQAGKQPDPIYLAPAQKIIKTFEGASWRHTNAQQAFGQLAGAPPALTAQQCVKATRSARP